MNEKMYSRYSNWSIEFISKECPHKMLYKISSKYGCSKIFFEKGKNFFKIPLINYILYGIDDDDDTYEGTKIKFWLTWYNGILKIGTVENSKYNEPFFEFKDPEPEPKPLIGFVKFANNEKQQVVVETSPVIFKPIVRNVEGGQLRWVKMTGDELPEDALIGGFENEPIYIARAMHNSSLCPGKYIQSQKKAFVPWGHEEHEKDRFEILCGFDALWVKCNNDFVPENVFVAGKSEINNEDIYIGRAMIENHLIIGKVHMLYKTCYLPYNGKEVEKYEYEILVRGNVKTHGIGTKKNCSLNPIKAIQPCI